MNLKHYKITIIVLLFFTALSYTKAQSFGFGCLGLSGFYGGYTQQYYKADGIDDYIHKNYTSLSSNNPVKFNRGSGFRIGANIFRANFDAVFITVKGYYQFLKEEHNIDEPVLIASAQEIMHKKFQLSMNHWGVGLDFGFPLFSIVDLKLIEGGVTFYNSEFIYNYALDNAQQSEVKMSPDKIQVGYYVGSGLIINLIRDYISIEGTAAYSLLKIDKMSSNSGAVLPSIYSDKRAIESGGFSATIQLNVGFPL